MDRWHIPLRELESYDEPTLGKAYFSREIHLSGSDSNRIVTSMRRLESVLAHPDTIRTHDVRNINVFTDSLSVPSNIYFGEDYKQAQIRLEHAPHANEDKQEGRAHLEIVLIRDEKSSTCITLDLIKGISTIEPLGPELPDCDPEDIEALPGPDELTVYTLLAELLGPEKSKEFLTDNIFLNTPIVKRYSKVLQALSGLGSTTITESLFLEDKGDSSSNTQTYSICRSVDDPEFSETETDPDGLKSIKTPFNLNLSWEQSSYAKDLRGQGRPIGENYEVQVIPKSKYKRKNTPYTITSAKYAAGLYEHKALVDDELRKWIVASFIGKSALLGGITKMDGSYLLKASFADEVEEAVGRAQLSAMV